MNKNQQNLYNVILQLKNLDEADRFFRDLLTAQEIKEFSKRWQVAKMLSEKISYSEIEKRTKLSSTTVARISKWLISGCGGYRLMIKRTHHNSTSLKRKLS